MYSKPAEWDMICTGLEITIFLCKKAEKVSETPSLVLWLKLPRRECCLTLIVFEILFCSWKLAFCICLYENVGEGLVVFPFSCL